MMCQPSRFTLCLGVLAFSLVSLPLACSSRAIGDEFGHVVSGGDGSFAWDEIQYVYAFGDSYTYVQGTEGLANFRYAVFTEVLLCC